jgi:hypothetical protein
MAEAIEKTEVFLFVKFGDEDVHLFMPERSEILDSFLEWKLDSEGNRCTTTASIKAAGLRIIGELESDGETILVAVLPYRLTRA